METILIVLGAAALVILIILAGKSRWTTLDAAKGHQAEDLQRKYAFLQSRNISSRLKTEAVSPGSGFTAGSGMGIQMGGQQNEMIKLQVRPKEKQRALEALKELEREMLMSHTPPPL